MALVHMFRRVNLPFGASKQMLSLSYTWIGSTKYRTLSHGQSDKLRPVSEWLAISLLRFRPVTLSSPSLARFASSSKVELEQQICFAQLDPIGKACWHALDPSPRALAESSRLDQRKIRSNSAPSLQQYSTIHWRGHGQQVKTDDSVFGLVGTR